jgi:hypothetical protein
MVLGTTIKIFLADGTPEGLRIIEKSNWTGRGFDFSRADWLAVRARPDFERPGVYVLTGRGSSGDLIVYIGEADELRARLNQHFANKDFWTRSIAFTSKDENLNKAHVRYLESRLIELGRSSKRASLENGTIPSQPSLSESDRAEAEAFLQEMLVVYPLVGVSAFEQVKPVSSSRPTMTLKGRGIEAFGHDAAEGFVVHKGSRAAPIAVPSTPLFLANLRGQLLADGVLVPDGSSLQMTQDYTFDSPSTAAGVMLGRNANGRDAWKDEQGRSLKMLQSMTS